MALFGESQSAHLGVFSCRRIARGVAVPSQHRAEVVLASLRGVERELASTEPGSPEAEFLHATAARLRSEYRQLVEDVRGHGRPEPPSLPEEPEGP
jgi:hypothetical protein